MHNRWRSFIIECADELDKHVGKIADSSGEDYQGYVKCDLRNCTSVYDMFITESIVYKSAKQILKLLRNNFYYYIPFRTV